MKHLSGSEKGGEGCEGRRGRILAPLSAGDDRVRGEWISPFSTMAP